MLELKHKAEGTDVSEAELLVKQRRTFPDWFEKRVSIKVVEIKNLVTINV